MRGPSPPVLGHPLVLFPRLFRDVYSTWRKLCILLPQPELPQVPRPRSYRRPASFTARKDSFMAVIIWSMSSGVWAEEIHAMWTAGIITPRFMRLR